jgi:hypothetical protein
MVDRLESTGRAEGSMARRDLVALVASASPGGATVADLDATVDRIVTFVGAEGVAGRGREPRWRTGDVLSVARQRGSDLGLDRGISSSTTIDRRRSRERVPSRDVGRSEERRHGRDWGLGR